MSVVYQYQQSSSPEADRGSFRKKILILLGLLAACLVVMLVVAALGSSRGVKKTATDDNAQLFLKAVREKDDGALEGMTTLELDISEKDAIERGNQLEELRGSADLESCNPQQTQPDRVVFACDSYKRGEDSGEVPQTLVTLILNKENKITEIHYSEVEQ